MVRVVGKERALGGGGEVNCSSGVDGSRKIMTHKFQVSFHQKRVSNCQARYLFCVVERGGGRVLR